MTVREPGAEPREPYAHHRLVDGTTVTVEPRGLSWLRGDSGTALLIRGPTSLTVRSRSLAVHAGKVFFDSPSEVPEEIATPAGKVLLVKTRASVTVEPDGATRVYVLSGEVRLGELRAGPGEELFVPKGARGGVTPVVAWEDWTGGLATTERAPAPAPFGMGTVGSRRPGEEGQPRSPLVIQRMDVRVQIQGDLAITEVDQSFFNSRSDVVEGIYSFRTPPRAILQRFGVDRDGALVWARVQERGAARAQYEEKVYQGSTEDPALLEWDAPGSYRARLYPIGPGESRRVVVRYAEWLDRGGMNGERRLYVFPLAAEGSEESLPRVEELKMSVDLARAEAKTVRTGMAGVREGDTILIRRNDFVPRADVALELFDDGDTKSPLRAYRAPHTADLETLAPDAVNEARRRAGEEADYLLVPVRPRDVPNPPGGLDLAIVIDTSAKNDGSTLAVARSAVHALLSHLGPDDRVVVLAADAALRPVIPDATALQAVSSGLRDRVFEGLATLEKGGATDLGAVVSQASALLDGSRRNAVVYVGDGVPTVGELGAVALSERLDALPRPVRLFALGIGDTADLPLLSRIARGGFAERVSDGHQAARAALRVLEGATQPVVLALELDLGPNVERIFPRKPGTLRADESLLLVGRLVNGKQPEELVIRAAGATNRRALDVVRVNEHGDLARRWGEQRLAQMLSDGEGRASMVELGMRHGIITPVTSLYVPTRAELTEERQANRPASQEKEGGTGMFAKGEALASGHIALKRARATAVKEQPETFDRDSARAPAPLVNQSAAGFGAGHGRLGGSHSAPAHGLRPGVSGLGLSGTGGLRPADATVEKSRRPASSRTSRDEKTEAAPKPPSSAPPPVQNVNVQVHVGLLARRPVGCSEAANAPLDERARLWRERLRAATDTPPRAAQIYRKALFDCEAPTARERSRLLWLLLDAMTTVSQRVQLYRVMFQDLGASDVLYAGILARIRTPAERREFHEALGVRHLDPDYLRRIEHGAGDAVDRVRKLRALRVEWPSDPAVALALLHALERANDREGALALARTLRLGLEADARTRTAVGELYLRMARAGADEATRERLTSDARRAFGEIVEFAPEDPIARRRLGDLLLSHGWAAEARRQYETLAGLTPDDSTVGLLLARAAEAQGLYQEALKWTEKAISAGSPESPGGLPRTARALAATYLAWARSDARQHSRAAELEVLMERSRQVLSGSAGAVGTAGARIALTWTHPEFHPVLWTNGLGPLMPSSEGDPTLGVAQASVSGNARRVVEIRLQPEDLGDARRLGARAELTVVFDELTDTERIVRVPIVFDAQTDATLRFEVHGREVTRG